MLISFVIVFLPNLKNANEINGPKVKSDRLLVGAAVWWLWWRLPKQQVARLALKICDLKARADVENNFRYYGDSLFNPFLPRGRTAIARRA